SDQKCNFGAEVVGDRDNENVPDRARAAKKRTAFLRRLHGNVRRHLIHRRPVRRRGTVTIASVLGANEAAPKKLERKTLWQPCMRFAKMLGSHATVARIGPRSNRHKRLMGINSHAKTSIVMSAS